MSDDGKVEVMLIGDDGKGEVMLIGIALVLTLTFCAGHYFGEKDMCKEIKGPEQWLSTASVKSYRGRDDCTM